MLKYLVMIVLLLPVLVSAEPTTQPLKISKIRPYNMVSTIEDPAYGAVYVHTDTVSLCGTSVYKIDLAMVG